MAAPQLTLNIPEPCAEAWKDMTPVAGGRHCKACVKTVIDFTTATDAELIRFFRRNDAASVCCRLHETQVNRPLQPPPPQPFWRGQWQRAAALLLAIQALTTEAFARDHRKAHTTVSPTSRKAGPRMLKGRFIGFSSSIYGPVSFRLRINAADTITVNTDSTGNFNVPLPAGSKGVNVSWDRQEVAGGMILADTVQLATVNEQTFLTVTWQTVIYLEPVAIEADRYRYYERTGIYGGAPIATYSRPVRKPSFFRRAASLFHKKRHS